MTEINETHEITVKDFYKAFFGERLPMTIARVHMYTVPLTEDSAPDDGSNDIVRHYASKELAEKMLVKHGYTFDHAVGASREVWKGCVDNASLWGTYQDEAEIETIQVLLEPAI